MLYAVSGAQKRVDEKINTVEYVDIDVVSGILMRPLFAKTLVINNYIRSKICIIIIIQSSKQNGHNRLSYNE